MKRYIKILDTIVTNKIGLIPASARTSFVWLGHFTTPLMWMTAFVLLHILLITPFQLTQAAAAVIVLLPLATVMKLFFRRRRPPTIYAASMRIKSYSFPSSHAYSATLSGGYLAYEAFTTGMVMIGIVLSLLIIIIGISRVHVGAHYPSDVMAGWVLGAGLLVGVVTFLV